MGSQIRVLVVDLEVGEKKDVCDEKGHFPAAAYNPVVITKLILIGCSSINSM